MPACGRYFLFFENLVEQKLTFGSPAGFEMKEKKNCLLAHVFLFFHLSKRRYFVLQEVQVTWPALADTSGFSIAAFHLSIQIPYEHMTNTQT